MFNLLIKQKNSENLQHKIEKINEISEESINDFVELLLMKLYKNFTKEELSTAKNHLKEKSLKI